ncbi:MAG: SdpI family protein [Bacteroidota bacterium]
MKKSNTILVILMAILPFAYAIYLYPSLNMQIPIHFNIEGKPDGWGSRESIFIAPGILGLVTIVVYFLLLNIEKFDPKRVSKSDNAGIKSLGFFISIFLTILSLCILYGSAHDKVPMDKLILGILSLLFIGIGIYMPKLEQNYFAGYRIPWTLDNEENWKATHKLAGKCWSGAGFLQFIISILFKGKWLFIGFMSLTILAVIIPVILSFILFKRSNVQAK